MIGGCPKFVGFKDAKFTIIGIVALGLLVPIIFFHEEFDPMAMESYIRWIVGTIIAAVYWLSTRWIMIWFRKIMPHFKDTKRRILWTIATSIGFATLFCLFTMPSFEEYLHSQLGGDIVKHNPIDALTATFISIIFFLAVYESIWYYNKLQEVIKDQELTKVAHVQSQLDGLRNQVNPHFLFNSLNTLSHIVESEEKDVAKRFIVQLSKVYRYILESREETTISLADELDFVQSYVDIQKERFLDNLTFDIQVDAKYLDKKIIPLSVQLLIENAIKHNVISSVSPLNIAISIDSLTDSLIVANNLQRKSKVLHSTKVGLKNITDRYRLLSKNKLAYVNETENSFSVVLPLL